MRDFVKASIAWNRLLKRSVLVLIVLVALSLTACQATKNLSKSHELIDSVVVIEIPKDTVVIIEGDQSMIRALLECDSLGQVRIKQLIEWQSGNRLKPPDVAVENNILTAAAHVDSMSIYLQYKERYERHLTTSTRIVHDVVEVNRLTGWQKWWMRTGQLLTILLLLLGGFKLRKILTI